MKAVQVFALMGFASLSMAQDLAPSPSESIGCEPHGDHWHCEGPRVTEAPVESSAAVVPTTSAAPDHEHEHDHDHNHDDDEDHDHDHATQSLAPSPTESVGCEPHGDHWHCEGPATQVSSGLNTITATITTTSATPLPSGNGTTPGTVTSPVPEGGAAGFGTSAVGAVAVAALFAVFFV